MHQVTCGPVTIAGWNKGGHVTKAEPLCFSLLRSLSEKAQTLLPEVEEPWILKARWSWFQVLAEVKGEQTPRTSAKERIFRND